MTLEIVDTHDPSAGPPLKNGMIDGVLRRIRRDEPPPREGAMSEPPTTVPVRMLLTRCDVARAQSVVDLIGSRNRATAVSTALAIAELILQENAMGADLCFHHPDGRVERLVLKGRAGNRCRP
jgi:hypothetical protein